MHFSNASSSSFADTTTSYTSPTQVTHTEKVGGEGAKPSQSLIDTRGKALYYATQLVSVEAAWEISNDGKFSIKMSLETMKENIKEIAKQYEEQMLRREK